MKRNGFILILFAAAVFFLMGFQLQAAEKAKSGKMTFRENPTQNARLKKEFKKQWIEVQKQFPAVAMAFLRQEAAIAALTNYHIETAAESLSRYMETSDTIVATTIKDSMRLNGCIEGFRRCDMDAGSDGSFGVEEVKGCRKAFESCWKDDEFASPDD